MQIDARSIIAGIVSGMLLSCLPMVVLPAAWAGTECSDAESACNDECDSKFFGDLGRSIGGNPLDIIRAPLAADECKARCSDAASECESRAAAQEQQMRQQQQQKAAAQQRSQQEQEKLVLAYAYEDFKKGDYPSAIGKFKAGLKTAPDNALVHYFLGQSYDRTGDEIRAVGYYRSYVTLAPAGQFAGQVKERMVAINKTLAARGLAGEPLRVGVLVPLSGPFAQIGQSAKNTVEMLSKDLNTRGGVNGHPLVLEITDTASNPAGALERATELIKDEKVSAIIGPSITEEATLVKALVEKERIPLLSLAGGLKVNDPVNPWVFRIPADEQPAVEKMLDYVAGQGQKRLALYTSANPFGAAGRAALQNQAGRKGLTVVSDVVASSGRMDMTVVTGEITPIRDANPDAIICWGGLSLTAMAAKAAKQLGIKPPLYMNPVPAWKQFIQVAGAEAAEGMTLPVNRVAVYDKLKGDDPQTIVVREYGQAYQKARGDDYAIYGGFAYDALQLIVNAARKRGFASGQIRDGIEQTSRFTGVTGVYNLSPGDHNGLDASAFVMVRVVRGDFAIVK